MILPSELASYVEPHFSMLGMLNDVMKRKGNCYLDIRGEPLRGHMGLNHMSCYLDIASSTFGLSLSLSLLSGVIGKQF